MRSVCMNPGSSVLRRPAQLTRVRATSKAIPVKSDEKHLQCSSRAASLVPRAAAKAEGAKAEDQLEKKSDDKKSDDYSADMQAKMGTTLTYNHDAGLNYNRILPDLIENCDMEYFSLDIVPIQERAKERGDIQHVRFPVRDFDPFDLRLKLPDAVSTLAKAHADAKGGTVYIHCTAGLGRAPAAALAYMNWVRGMQLDEAEALLTGIRRCSPKVESIRSATADMLLDVKPVEVCIGVTKCGAATDIRIAGLDIGWHTSVPLVKNNKLGRFEMRRSMLPGSYQYKFIVDGNWTYSMDHPSVQDGQNINNIIKVVAPGLDEEKQAKQMRYISKGTTLTDEDKADLMKKICPWE
eukprot:gene8085-1327_t